MIDGQRIKQRAKLIRPLLIPLVLYLGLLVVAVTWAPKLKDSIWGYAVALLPLLPGLFLTLGIVRVTTQIDEMERRIILEAAAFSFIFTLLLLLSFALLGLVGVPQPSNTWIVFIMSMLLIVGKLWGNWRYR
jgi:hypothetical protein